MLVHIFFWTVDFWFCSNEKFSAWVAHIVLIEILRLKEEPDCWASSLKKNTSKRA